jgi:hypothetical protein
MGNRYFSQFGFWLGISLPFFSCNQNPNQAQQEERIPEFYVTDSLIIDYLGILSMLDIKKDRSEYLLYDFQQKKYLRVNGEGEILAAKTFSKDGKDSFSDIMISFVYTDDDDLLLVGMNGIYRYDMSFNLKAKIRFPVSIMTNSVGGTNSCLLVEDKLFVNFSPINPSSDFFQQKDYLANYPFLSVFDLVSSEIIQQAYIPSDSRIIREPGQYRETAPHALIYNNDLYLLFPNSPEIYHFSYPALELIGKIDLNPGAEYVQVEPVHGVENSVERFFADLSGSSFIHFSVSGEYFLTGYLGAVPKEKVDALPRNVIGGKEFMDLSNAYKKPFYQVFSDESKVWEGELDINFKYKGGRLFASRNLNLPKIETELDYVAFYFYEIK